MRNSTYEQVLDKAGVKWSYAESLPIGDIDKKASIGNQARLHEPLDKDLANVYRDAMKPPPEGDGYEFPPLVVWRPTSKHKWVLIDGNHRLDAKTQLAMKTTDAYIVHIYDKRVADRLTRTFNNLVNGRRLTYEECMEHAVAWQREYKDPIEQVAKDWGVKFASLANRLRAEHGKDILRQHNLSWTESLSDWKITKLAGMIASGEDLFCKACMAVSQCGATDRDVEELLKAVSAAKTSTTKAAAVEAFVNSERMQERRAETRGGRKPKTRQRGPADKLMLLLRQMDNLLGKFPDDKALMPAPSERKDAIDMVKHITGRLVPMVGAGAVPEVGDAAKAG